MRRPPPNALRAAFASSGVGLVVAAALAWAARVPLAEHQRYTLALRRAGHLDAQLNGQVAAAHMGFVDHYDDLVRTGDGLAAIRAELARLPAYIPAHHGPAVVQALGELDAAIAQKAVLVEQFKTDRAVVRNASRAFPASIDRLTVELRDEGKEGLAQAVLVALSPALEVAVDPSAERRTRAACGLALLAPDGAGGPDACAGGEGPALLAGSRAVELAAGVRQLGEVLLSRQQRLETVTEALMTMPVGAAALALASAYDAAHAEAVVQFDRRLGVVNLLLMVFVGAGALLVVVRLAADAEALRATTARLHEAMAALQLERDRDAELARLKNRFVAMTSHEFRTPLSVILSSAELLDAYGEGWPQDRRQKHLDRIADAGRAMSRLIDRILVIGRADAAMLDVQPRMIGLGALVEEVLAEVRAGPGADRAIEVRGDVPADPRCLDPKLLHHILTNLLSNALKYSPSHSLVTFEVRVGADGVGFVVCDEGIGIPEQDLPHLFEPFHRAENVGEVAGTGLGLAIVARAVDVLGGSLTVDSTLDQGSCFTAWAPYLELEP